ncbi:MAG: hypothetical protein Q4D81_03670 [Eubacteriales bacterium]|nr:hypothetical protein [Eubacteriales bacterium]
MGSKLEAVKEQVEQAKENHYEALEMGQRDVEDISNIKSILEGIPSDVDDDILEAASDVHDTSISEATSDMESSVKQSLDAGSDIADEASGEAQEQQELSEDSARSFEQISGSSEFGGSAEGAADRAHESAESFGETSDEAMESIEEAEEEFFDQLSEIQS